MRLLRGYASLFRAVYLAFQNPRVHAALLVCALIAVTQAFLFTWVEGWSFLDAFYFAVVSMATVGYGDLTPTTPLGKVLCIIFLVIGIGIFVLTVSTVAQAIMREFFEEDRRPFRGEPGSHTLRGDDDHRKDG